MIVSITHGEDLDGIGSQAILLRYLQLERKIKLGDIQLEYANYSTFIKKLKIISDNAPSEVYISDIGFNVKIQCYNFFT